MTFQVHKYLNKFYVGIFAKTTFKVLGKCNYFKVLYDYGLQQ